MKKFFLIVVVLFLIVVVNATPVLEIEHATYQPGETLFATISTSGNFLQELDSDDITFYDGNKQVFFGHNLYYHNGIYYLDVIFTKEGMFTIKTPEILFNLAGEVGSVAIEQTIPVFYNNYDNVTDSYIDVLSIKPGIIYTISNKSELKLFNRGTNPLTINIGDISTSIGGLQAETIYLNLEQPLTYVVFSTYKTFSVPIIYLGPIINTSVLFDNQTNVTIKENELFFIPEEIEIIVKPNEVETIVIVIDNQGDNEITDIKILNEINTATIEVPGSVSAQSSGEIIITVTSEYTSFVSDSIILNYVENETEYNKTIPITIFISKGNETEIPDPVGGTCSELGGDICDGECDGDSEFTTDGYCCIGKCVESGIVDVDVSDGTSYQWIAGILIFIVLGVLGYFVYKKYKKTKPESPGIKLDKSKDRYENRLQGRVKDKVVRD